MFQRAALIATIALLQPGLTHAAGLDVVATVGDLAAIVQAVGGERVKVAALASPSQDPHFVDARPSFVLALSNADLLIVQGRELEAGWLPPMLTNARNAKIQPGAAGHLDASAAVRRLGAPSGKVDRSMGDVHAGGNPHFTYDPREVRRLVKVIAKRLATLDAEHAGEYRARAATYDATLNALIEAEQTRFRALPARRRQIVAYHESFPYLWDWLGVQQVATVEPKPGVPPNPRHVASVLKTMRQTKARVIAQEEYYPQSTTQTLARLGEAELVVVPGNARFGDGETYVDRIKRMTEALYVALAR